MITFSDNISRKPYLGSTEIAEVWLGNVKIYPDGIVPPTPIDYSTHYLTFVASENGTFTFTPHNSNSISYSTDNGTTWTVGNTVSVNSGDKVLWMGNCTSAPGSIGIGQFSSTGKFDVEGNPMSLLFSNNFIGHTDLTEYGYVLEHLFYNCTNLVNAKNLSLPATTLVERCYMGMFYGCTSLTTAPVLPATTLADYCYHGMFQGCTSLTIAPELPATTMVLWCYGYMFENCTSLVTAPVLSATTLAKDCYHRMFQGCTSLTTAPVLPATTLADHCYYFMFNDCISLNYIKCMATDISANDCTGNWVRNVAANGTFVKASSMNDWTTGISGVPSGWTVVDA